MRRGTPTCVDELVNPRWSLRRSRFGLTHGPGLCDGTQGAFQESFSPKMGVYPLALLQESTRSGGITPHRINEVVNRVAFGARRSDRCCRFSKNWVLVRPQPSGRGGCARSSPPTQESSVRMARGRQENRAFLVLSVGILRDGGKENRRGRRYGGHEGSW
jgi:hypothetical protein